MEDTFRVVNMLSHAAGPIGCIRFSPDGNRMVAGSLDGNAYIYSVLENFKLEVRETCLSIEAAIRMDDAAWMLLLRVVY